MRKRLRRAWSRELLRQEYARHWTRLADGRYSEEPAASLFVVTGLSVRDGGVVVRYPASVAYAELI